VNDLDRPVAPQQFVPEALLVVTDNNRNRAYSDQSNSRSARRNPINVKGKLQNSVRSVGPVPEQRLRAVPKISRLREFSCGGESDPDAKSLSGVFNRILERSEKSRWSGWNTCDPNETIMQKYWKRGDRYNQRESETVLDGDRNGSTAEPPRVVCPDHSSISSIHFCSRRPLLHAFKDSG